MQQKRENCTLHNSITSKKKKKSKEHCIFFPSKLICGFYKTTVFPSFL